MRLPQYSFQNVALIVEESATNESRLSVERRMSQYLLAGAERVWLLLPDEDAIVEYGRLGQVRVMDGSEPLPSSEICPKKVLAGELLRHSECSGVP